MPLRHNPIQVHCRTSISQNANGTELNQRPLIRIVGATVPFAARQTVVADTESTLPLRCLLPRPNVNCSRPERHPRVRSGGRQAQNLSSQHGHQSQTTQKVSPAPLRNLMGSGNQRHFCPECGSHLYAYDERWPQWIYPYPSCIDTPLPKPKKYVYICLDSKVSWVDVPKGGEHCQRFSDKGIEEWHKAEGCFYGGDEEEEEDKPEVKKQKTSKKK